MAMGQLICKVKATKQVSQIGLSAKSLAATFGPYLSVPVFDKQTMLAPPYHGRGIRLHLWANYPFHRPCCWNKEVTHSPCSFVKPQTPLLEKIGQKIGQE
eukprot:1272445-Amphidinium_carterae.1